MPKHTSRGGSRHGAPGNSAGPSGRKVKASGSVGPGPTGRMKAPGRGKSSFKAGISGSSGPSPAERLAKASSGQPVCGKAKP